MILHIPHASTLIPSAYRDAFVMSDRELADEHLLMTDAFTDVLFNHPKASRVVFPLSRLLVDVERFREDEVEPMFPLGMGVLYVKTADGRALRRNLSGKERLDLLTHYDAHHDQLYSVVEAELEERGEALIIDAHSFPDTPLPCHWSTRTPRPDFCIGTDAFHTPTCLSSCAEACLVRAGYSVWIDEPFKGSLVPQKYYQQDQRVLSIMIEVNRRLYMNESTGQKTPAFTRTKNTLTTLLNDLSNAYN